MGPLVMEKFSPVHEPWTGALGKPHFGFPAKSSPQMPGVQPGIPGKAPGFKWTTESRTRKARNIYPCIRRGVICTNCNPTLNRGMESKSNARNSESPIALQPHLNREIPKWNALNIARARPHKLWNPGFPRYPPQRPSCAFVPSGLPARSSTWVS